MANLIIILKNITLLSMFILRMMIRLLLGISFIVIILLGSLSFTTKGTVLLWNIAANNVEGLSGEVVDGHLGRGITLKNVKFNSPSFNLEAQSLDVSYNILDLLHGELNLSRVNAEDLLIVIGGKPQDLPPIANFLLKRLADVSSYTLNTQTNELEQLEKPQEDDTLKFGPIAPPFTQDLEEKPQEVARPNTYLNFPVKIIAKKMNVSHFLLLTEAVDVAVGELIMSAEAFGNTIDIAPSEVSFVDVRLHNERFTDDSNETKEVKDLTNNKLTNNKKTVNFPQELDYERSFLYLAQTVNASFDTEGKSIIDDDLVSYVNAYYHYDSEHDYHFANSQLAPFLQDPFNDKNIARFVEKLPEVFIPLKLNIKSLKMNFVKYHQDGYSTGVMLGDLSGHVAGSNIEVDKFFVTHSLGQATLIDSKITLKDYYPIDAKLVALSHNKEWFDFLHTHALSLSATGDLANLHSNMRLKGKMNLNARIELGAISPKLPFKVSLHGKNIGYPILEPEYKVGELTFSSEGSLLAITSSFKAKDVALLDYPSMDISGKITNDFVKANIKNLKITSADDSLTLAGKVFWDNGYGFIGKLNGKVTDITRYKIATQASAQINVATNLYYKDNDNWEALIDNIDVIGKLRGYPLEIIARNIKANSKGEALIDNLHLLASKENEIKVSGNLNDKVDFKGDIKLNNLALLDENLSGEIIGNFSASGSRKSPQLNIKLASEMVSYQDFRLEDLGFKAKLLTNNFVLKDSMVNLSLASLREAKKVMLENLSLNLQGGEDKHNLDIDAQILNSPFKARALGSLSKERTTYQGALNTLSYKYQNLDFELASSLEFFYNKKGEFNAKPHSWSIAHNKVNIEKLYHSTKFSNVVFVAQNFRPMRLRKFLPPKLVLRTKLNAQGDIKLTNNIITGNIAVNSKNGTVFYDRKGQKYKDLAVNIDLFKDKALAKVLLDLGNDGLISLSPIVYNPLAAKPTLGGKIAIKDLNLGIVDNFVPAISNSVGLLNVNGQMGGDFITPTFNGKLTIKDMSVNFVANIGRIYDINTQIDFLGTRADLVTNFLLNGKEGKIKGNMSWDNGFDAKINLLTQEVPINLLGYGAGRIKLDVQGEFGDELNVVNGIVYFPYAKVVVKTLPESSIGLSSDVIEISRDNSGFYSIKKQSTSPVSLDLKLAIGPEVSVSAMGLKTNINGKLDVIQQPNKNLVINGRIDLVDGKFKAYGQNLEIENGRITFVGDPNNPNISVRAIRDPDSMSDDSITVGISVTGNANRPRITLFSKPQMSQTETLSYLLRGKGLDASNANTSDMTTQLLLGVGLMQTSSFIGSLGEKIGIEDVALDSRGDGEETSVEVSAYVLPKVQVAYGYGIYNALSEFRIKYEMFPRFYIEGVSSLQQAIDAIYSFEF